MVLEYTDSKIRVIQTRCRQAPLFGVVATWDLEVQHPFCNRENKAILSWKAEPKRKKITSPGYIHHLIVCFQGYLKICPWTGPFSYSGQWEPLNQLFSGAKQRPALRSRTGVLLGPFPHLEKLELLLCCLIHSELHFL